MKLVRTDPWHGAYLSACPKCALPLEVVVPWTPAQPITWLDGMAEVDTCPRCDHELPAVDFNHGDPRLAAA